MASQYQVQPGDCIFSIAHDHGLPWEKIWNHANNAELKKVRKDPNILREGDQVFIPDREQRTLSLATGARHKIVVKRPVVKLRLRVVIDLGPKPPPPPPPPLRPPADRRNITEEDPPPDNSPRTDEPRKNLAYKLIIDGVTTEGNTDGDGYVDCEIPVRARAGQLVLAPGTPHETEVALNLGHLDPISEITGIKQRLRNLCFDCGDQSPEMNEDLATALRAFQAKHGLSVSGQIDQMTRDELQKQHGS
jgi:hypothetical protein